MKIAVIGASAGVGLEVAHLALLRGHDVATLSRRTEPLPEHPRLRKVRGSSLNPQDVREVLRGAEVVIVTLGTGMSTKPTVLYSASTDVLLQVLQESEQKPLLIALTGFGAGDSWEYNSPLMKILFNLLLKKVYADKSIMEKKIAASYPRWEIVRPGLLTNGEQQWDYQVQDELRKGMKVRTISRQDVAHFLVTQAECPTYLGQYPAISY